MRESVSKANGPDAQKENIAQTRQHLADITRLGKELREIGEEEWVQRKGKTEPDPKLQVRMSEIRGLIEPYVPLVGEALTKGVLVEDALKACYELLTTHEFELRVAERIADNAQSLGERLQAYPPYTELLVQTMVESFAAIRHEHYHKKHHDDAGIPPSAIIRRDVEKRVPPSAMKIRRAIDDAAPALRVFFSEANTSSASEVKGRLESLQQIASTASVEKSQWVLEAMAHLFVRAIRTPQYNAGLSTHEEIVNIFRVPAKKAQKAEHAITRGDLESLLLMLEPRQPQVVLSEIFKGLGLPADSYMEHAVSLKSLRPVIDQFESIQALELQESGSAGELFRRFGIRWFSRYPLHVLKRQYDERENTDNPYGVFLSAVHDWTGAFSQDNDREVVDTIAHQLKSLGHSFRIVECNSKQELARTFLTLDELYGGQHKVSFLFVRAHSSKGHLEFGKGESEDDPRVDIDLDDLSGKGFAKGKRFFVEEPTIIFDGCSVGRRGGIAEKTSEVFSARVLAPKSNYSALTDVKISRAGEKLVFVPVYEDEKDAKNVPPHVYIKGRKR